MKKQKISRLNSLFILFSIHIIRIIDQLQRGMTGLPTIKRSMITPNLYIGGQYRRNALILFQKIGITAVINMRTKPIFQEKDIAPLKLLNLPTRDRTAPTKEQLKKGVEFIKEQIDQGGKVYIHCRFGEGRGPTMGAAYLISQGVTADDALSEIKKIRPFIRVSKSQRERLQQLAQMPK